MVDADLKKQQKHKTKRKHKKESEDQANDATEYEYGETGSKSPHKSKKKHKHRKKHKHKHKDKHKKRHHHKHRHKEKDDSDSRAANTADDVQDENEEKRQELVTSDNDIHQHHISTHSEDAAKQSYHESIDKPNTPTIVEQTQDKKHSDAEEKKFKQNYWLQESSDSFWNSSDDAKRKHHKNTEKHRHDRSDTISQSDDASNVYQRVQQIPFIGDIVTYCLAPIWSAVLSPCCSSFVDCYNKAFPEEDEIIDDNSWGWEPEDRSELLIYFLLLSLFIFSLINLIGNICIDILGSDVERFITYPKVMAGIFPPIILVYISFIFLMSKFKAIHILHFEIPLLMLLSSVILTCILSSLAEHSEIKMELKCLEDQREIDEDICTDWFGAWRVCVGGMSGMIITMVLLAITSIWRRNSIIALQHLNDPDFADTEPEKPRPTFHIDIREESKHDSSSGYDVDDKS